MPYATTTQIQYAAGGSAALLELSDQEGVNTLNMSVIANAQAAAEAWMHEYLRERFSVPVIPTTQQGADTLADISARETVYVMKRDRPIGAGEHDHQAHAERELRLKAFADGARRPDEPLPNKSTAVAAAFVPNCSSVSRDGLKGIW